MEMILIRNLSLSEIKPFFRILNSETKTKTPDANAPANTHKKKKSMTRFSKAATINPNTVPAITSKKIVILRFLVIFPLNIPEWYIKEVSIREFRKLKLENPKAYILFIQHISAQGKVVKFFILTLMYISFFVRIPIIGNMLTSIKNLFLGYIVETRHIKDSIRLSSNVPTHSYKNGRIDEIYDYIIIGSGPGAAIAARKVVDNFNVLVIEQGDFPVTPTMLHHSLSHVRNDFYKSGQEFALGPWMPQFTQGSVIGGGSEVNSGLYHDLPETLMESLTSAACIKRQRYQEAEIEIRNILKVSRMLVDGSSSLIQRGAIGMGLENRNIPRWRTYSEDGSYTHHGMINAIWEKLFQSPNFSLLTRSRVVLIDNFQKQFLKVKYLDNQGRAQQVCSRNVIVAAGAIQTPHLLCSSGLVPWNSTRFQWHPMLRTIVETNPSDLGSIDIDPFQAWTSDRQFKFGAAVSTPGLLGMNLGRILTEGETSRLRSIYISFVSSGKGGLIPHTKTPWYLPSATDKDRFNQSTDLLAKFVKASGAKYANPKEGIKRALSTVHIFGTLPIDSGLFMKGTSRLESESRVQVSDGSLLPFGPGVNPQGPIMTLSQAVVTE